MPRRGEKPEKERKRLGGGKRGGVRGEPAALLCLGESKVEKVPKLIARNQID